MPRLVAFLAALLLVSAIAPGAAVATTSPPTGAPGAGAPEAAGAGPGSTAADPLACVPDATLAEYRWKREQEFIAEAGARFLDALRARDPEVAANVVDAVRYQIQAEETAKFARQRRFVILAYGAVWAILALGAIALFLRQRRLTAQIAELEARLSRAGS